jgi:hypothetical protein
MKYAVACIALSFAAAANAEQNLNVTGDAEIKVVPDRVVMALGVEVHSKTLADARRENDDRVRKVIAAAAGLGVDRQDIQTDFVQLGVEHENDGLTVRYYYTRKSIVITLRDIHRMEEVLAAAVDAGATHIHNVTFETTELRKYRDQARALAVKAAAEKARDLAGAAGRTVSEKPIGIGTWSYGGQSWYGSWWGGPRGYMAQNVIQEIGGGSAGSGTIALGRISVTASVSLTFALE